MPRHYVLLDACVAAAHYAPTCTSNKTLVSRATTLLTGTSTAVDVRFLMPNFCIAQVFAVFEKHRWGKTWNRQVKTVLKKKEFNQARNDFGKAIHNGHTILQVALDRYHVRCVDLISPINNKYKINRVRGGKVARDKAKNAKPASTYDMLVAAVGIWCVKQYGHDSFTLVTGDERLANVVYRAQSKTPSKPLKVHLNSVADRLGVTYAPKTLYPKVINLLDATKGELEARFPAWSLAWPALKKKVPKKPVAVPGPPVVTVTIT